jgi:hypothetical protein
MREDVNYVFVTACGCGNVVSVSRAEMSHLKCEYEGSMYLRNVAIISDNHVVYQANRYNIGDEHIESLKFVT